MSDCIVATIDEHTAEPGDELICEAAVLSHARPVVLVMTAPEDIEVTHVIAGVYVCGLERRSREVSIARGVYVCGLERRSREVSMARVEYVLTCSHDVAPGLAIQVRMKAPTGGKIKGAVLGTRANTK